MQDEADAFAAFEPLLHSDISRSDWALNTQKEHNFPAFRRRSRRLVLDADPSAFIIAHVDREHEPGVLKIFVRILRGYSDMPALFRFKPDPSAENAYRLVSY